MTASSLSRRSVLAAGAVGGIVAAGLRPELASAALPTVVPKLASATLPTVFPKLADDLVDAFGIDIHLNHRTTPYGNYPEVARWLGLLGVRHVRSRLSTLGPVLDAFADLAQQGIKIQGTCGALGDSQTMDQIMQTVRTRYPSPGQIFSAFEGINEPNNDGVLWTAETRSKTQALYAARAAHDLTGIPIVAPALARVTTGGVEGDNTWEQAGNLGDLTPVLDFGNMHIYPRGLPPSSDIAYFRSCSKQVSSSRQIFCTEGGYFTAMGYVGGANPVPEKVAAVYGPQALLEHWIAGTKRFFRYELLDDPSPSPTDREGTLGMIRTGTTWSPKPDFFPMQYLLHAMADPGPRFTPGGIEMSLTDRPADCRSAVFAKRDGTVVLALWLDRKVYDPQTRTMLVTDLKSPMATVRLTLGSARDISVRHLVDLESPTYHSTSTSRLIGLPAGVTLVTLS